MNAERETRQGHGRGQRWYCLTKAEDISSSEIIDKSVFIHKQDSSAAIDDHPNVEAAEIIPHRLPCGRHGGLLGPEPHALRWPPRAEKKVVGRRLAGSGRVCREGFVGAEAALCTVQGRELACAPDSDGGTFIWTCSSGFHAV